MKGNKPLSDQRFSLQSSLEKAGDASLLQLLPEEAEKLGRAGAWLGAMNPKGLPDGGSEGKQRGSRIEDLHGFFFFFILPGGSGFLALG